jgi:DNA-binding response OmpR family regulator
MAMNGLVAVVDDEKDITGLVELHLEKSNFKVRQFHDAGSFFSFLNDAIPDLLILDLMLPDADGLEICKHLKRDEKYSGIPVIMLTAKAEETDRVLGLEIGADDYVVKPFSPRELVARVKAVLRRRGRDRDTSKKILIGDLIEMDLQKYTVRVQEKDINLTTTEFRILELLGSKMGWVFTRDMMLQHLWGDEKYVLDRTIDVHIRHLRQKLGMHGGIIKNVRGVGYKLEL